MLGLLEELSWSDGSAFCKKLDQFCGQLRSLLREAGTPSLKSRLLHGSIEQSRDPFAGINAEVHQNPVITDKKTIRARGEYMAEASKVCVGLWLGLRSRYRSLVALRSGRSLRASTHVSI